MREGGSREEGDFRSISPDDVRAEFAHEFGRRPVAELRKPSAHGVEDDRPPGGAGGVSCAEHGGHEFGREGAEVQEEGVGLCGHLLHFFGRLGHDGRHPEGEKPVRRPLLDHVVRHRVDERTACAHGGEERRGGRTQGVTLKSLCTGFFHPVRPPCEEENFT